jgi:hypothetical protein
MYGRRLIRATLKEPAALRLSERCSARIGTRSLDVLRIAAAQSARTLAFITFDGRQRALATAIGFKVVTQEKSGTGMMTRSRIAHGKLRDGPTALASAYTGLH